MKSTRKRTDLARIWFIVSCAVLLFAYGVAVGRYRIFPFEILNYGVASLLQVRQEARMLLGIRPDGHLGTAHHEGDGVTIALRDRMAPGLTLVAGMIEEENQIRLIEADGRPVRVWTTRYSELFPGAEHLPAARRPGTDWNAQLHGALALPDGSVVFNFDYAGTVKLDRCGEVEWVLPHSTHHSIERSQGGGFWIPGRSYPDVVAGFPPSDEGYEEDLILKVSDAGEVLEEVHVAELFVENGLLPLLLLKGPGSVFRSGELVHLNDIEELPDSIAERFPGFEATDLLLSFRNLHMLMVVDPRSWTVRWHRIGPWIQQHDPDFQPDGTITIFDNRNDNTPRGAHLGGSAVVEIDPGTGTTRVRYGGRPEQDMHTGIFGKHQVLPNGNILITQSLSGRLLEVTATGEIVWELINRHDEATVAFLTQATRYPPSYFEVEDWTCAR